MEFFKYEGAGNDFIILDDRAQSFPAKETDRIRLLCDRHFGIGADGLILIQLYRDADFRMVYFNADGREGSMCGNGGRCAVAMANRMGLVKGERCVFDAVDGLHHAHLLPDGRIRLRMTDVTEIRLTASGDYALNTGSPHLVRLTDRLLATDVVKEGRKVRNSEEFRAEGINVNFVERSAEGVAIRTYERGVEDETLACGTGVCAAALVAHRFFGLTSPIIVHARGGDLEVEFREDGEAYRDIWKTGPTRFVFRGEWSLN